MNKKNILLVDPFGDTLKEIIKHTEWHISIWIAEQKHLKREYANTERIRKIYAYDDILTERDINYLDINGILEYQKVYNTIEYGMLRYGYSMPEIKYHFYLGISFLEKIFQNNTFNMCIIGNLVHGRIDDALLIVAAKKYNIPIYQLCHENADMTLISYKEKNSEYLLSLCEREHISDIQSTAKYYERKNMKPVGGIKQQIGSFVYNAFGACGIRILHSLARKETKIDSFNTYDFSIFKYSKGFMERLLLEKYIGRRYVKYDQYKKYVIYFLHFEPEATVANYANLMDSQLIIIKMLSSALPEDWVLYVKEHPDMYKLNTYKFDYYLATSNNFFNKYFVDTLLEIPNVKLLDYRIKSSELIQNAQAVATICGTVILEAVHYKKPLFIFANRDRVIYKYISDIFMISNVDDCKKGIKKIISGYVPNYKDFIIVMSRHCFYFRHTDSWKNALISIEKHFESLQEK